METTKQTLTSESLEKLIFHGKTADLVAALKPLSEKERKLLSRSAFDIYTVAKNKWEYRKISKKHERLEAKLHVLNTKDVFKRAQCAVLALCPLSKTKNVNQWIHFDGFEEWTFGILKDRNPAWLSDWIEYRLDNNNSVFLWELVRKLMALGLIEKPQTTGYLRSMVFYFNVWNSKKKQTPLPSIVDRLKKVPDTFEDIYRLFEIETVAFQKSYMESYSKKPENFQTWTTAIGILCEQGHLDRGRILDASLDGLNRGFPELQLSGFIKVHDHLNPTDQEITERQSAYIDLLNIRISRVSDFVLKKLSKLHRIRKLDAIAFFENISPITELSTKGPIKSALKLSKRIIRNQPEYTSYCYPLASDALKNESSDIQKLSCDLLEDLQDSISEKYKDELSTTIPSCSPSIQTRLYNLLGIEPINRDDRAVLKSEDFDRLTDKISQRPKHHRKMFGIENERLFNQFPPPVKFDILDTHLLSIVNPIQPIQSLEELIDAVSHAVEVVDSADEVERILDGISRLCDQKPDDFDIRTAALLKRVREPRFSESKKELISGWGRLSLAFKDLLHTWLTGNYYKTAPSFYDTDFGFLHIQINRLRELTRRVYKKDAGPLFAAPTHEHGWIDPIQLVARLRHLNQDWSFNRRYDITQALLRIAPDRRQEALAISSTIPLAIRKLVCWALGAKEGPSIKDKKEYELWIAAGRSRSPRRSLSEDYSVFRVKDNLPDSVLPASYTWTSSLRYTKSNPKYSFPEITISHNQEDIQEDTSNKSPNALPNLKDVQNLLKTSFKRLISLSSGPLWKRVPTAAMHTYNRAERYYIFSAWQIQWVHFIWPLHLDSCLKRGIQRMVSRIDENTASTIPLYCHLEPAFHPYRPWSEMTHLAIWTGIISKDTELQNVAIEALIEAIQDGRAHPKPLAHVLLQLSKGTWIKLNRLSSALEQVAAVSELHQFATCSILDHFVAGIKELPKNAHHILQLMLDLHMGLRLPVPNNTQSLLKELGGKSKTAQLARSLCEIKSEGEMSVIYAASIEGRLSLIDSLFPLGQP